MQTRALLVSALLSLSLSTQVSAADIRQLPYPTGKPDADEIAKQVHFVNLFYAFDRYAITKPDKRTVTVLVNQAEGKRPTTITVSRYKNNVYDDGVTRAKEIAIFHSGKLKGTGMLIEDFLDDSKSQSYSIWLPALRKIRRFAEPPHDDAWGGTDFTFGDVILRKPFHETHELLGTETFNDCLGSIPNVDTKWLQNPPEAYCGYKGKEVYKLKSTTKRENWWYDYRISYVDPRTFADYRTDYYKDGKHIKVIDRHWVDMGLEDPRAQSWGYWYGKTFATNHETWAVIPQETVVVNDMNEDESFWSEKTLRKIKR